MTIYSQNQINNNPLYAQLMTDINDLYVELKEPAHIQNDKSCSVTTGNACDSYWNSDEIGDWAGKESDAADKANALLDDVYGGLELSGNGGLSCYYTTSEWDQFVEQALDLLKHYHAEKAFDLLCDLGV